MRRQPSDPVVIIEHVDDPQGPAKITRAYEILSREAARARAERTAAAVAVPAGADPADHHSDGNGHA